MALKKVLFSKPLDKGMDAGGTDPLVTQKLLQAENVWKTRSGGIQRRPGFAGDANTVLNRGANGRMAKYKGKVIGFGPTRWCMVDETSTDAETVTPDEDDSMAEACPMASTRVENCVPDEDGQSAFDILEHEDGNMYVLSAWDKTNGKISVQVRDRATHVILKETVHNSDGPATLLALTESGTTKLFAVHSVSGVVYYLRVLVATTPSFVGPAILVGANALDTTKGYLLACHKRTGTPATHAALYYTRTTTGGQNFVSVNCVSNALTLVAQTEVVLTTGRHLGVDWDEYSDTHVLAIATSASTNLVYVKRLQISDGATASAGVTTVALTGTEMFLNATACIVDVGSGLWRLSLFLTRTDEEFVTEVDGGSAYLRNVLSAHTNTIYERALERATGVEFWRSNSATGSGGALTMTKQNTFPQVQLCGRCFRNSVLEESVNGGLEGQITLPVYFEGMGNAGLGIDGSSTTPHEWIPSMATAQRHLFLLRVFENWTGILAEGKSLNYASHWTGNFDYISGSSGDRQCWLPTARQNFYAGDFTMAVERVATPTLEAESRCGGALLTHFSQAGPDSTNDADMRDGIGRLLAPWGKTFEETEEHLWVAGSVPQMFDGRRFMEAGFLTYPEITLELVASGSALWSPGSPSTRFPLTVLYAAIYTEVDAKGHEHVSAYATRTIVVDLSSSTVYISIPWLPITGRRNAKIYVYRSEDGGATYQQIFAEDNETATAGTFLGGLTSVAEHSLVVHDRGDLDTVLSGAEVPLYTEGGLLQAVQPPPSSAVCEHQGRLFWVDADRQATRIEYSAPLQAPTGLRHSDFMAVDVPSDGGDIVAIRSWQDYLIVFKDAGEIFAVGGEGLSLQGLGAGYSRARKVASGLGCTSPRSLVETPVGLFFLSRRGFAVLTSGLGVQLVGNDVLRHSVDQDCVGAVYNAARNVVLFFVFGQGVLVLALDEMAWSRWTSALGGRDYYQCAIEGDVWVAIMSLPEGSPYSWTGANETFYVSEKREVSYDDDGEIYDDTDQPFIASISSGWESLGEETYLRRILFNGYIEDWGTLGELNFDLGYDYLPEYADGTQYVDENTNPNEYTWENLVDMSGAAPTTPGAQLYEIAPHPEGIRATSFRWRMYDNGACKWALGGVLYDMRKTGEAKRLGSRHAGLAAPAED